MCEKLLPAIKNQRLVSLLKLCTVFLNILSLLFLLLLLLLKRMDNFKLLSQAVEQDSCVNIALNPSAMLSPCGFVSCSVYACAVSLCLVFVLFLI